MTRTLAALLVAAVAGSGIAAAAASAPLLGLISVSPDSTRLVSMNPDTLMRRGGNAIDVGSGGCAARAGGQACWTAPPWTFSPERRLVAFARNERLGVRSLRLVDVERMRVSANVPLSGDPVGALAWPAPGRLLALQEDSGTQVLLAVDLETRRMTARRRLGGAVETLARTPNGLVLLVAPAGAIGPARLVVADSRAAVRSLVLTRMVAGLKVLGTARHAVDHRSPGLAVDPEGRRAFVVAPRLVAEVDLTSLAVAYHELGSREPAALTKTTTGFWRRAQWLGGGLLAVSGSDSESIRTRPAGLLVVDTRSWRVRTLDRDASHFVREGDLLLATGSVGLTAYGLDGAKRFAVFDGIQAFVAEVYDGRAYVWVRGQEPLRIVDLMSGDVVGERRALLPHLLDGIAGSWWEG